MGREPSVFYKNPSFWIIIGLVTSMAISIPVISTITFNLGKEQGAPAGEQIILPAQKNQWCTNESEHYLFIWEWMSYSDSSFTEKYISLMDLEEIRNNVSAIDNKNETYAYGQNYVWDDVGEYWEDNGTARIVDNNSFSYVDQFLIPLGYNNYTVMMDKIIEQQLWYWNDSVGDIVEIFNYSYDEVISYTSKEINQYLPYYSNENMLDGFYLATRYQFYFEINNTVSGEYTQVEGDYLFECNTGIPLHQSLIFIFWASGKGTGTPFDFTMNAKTVATSIKLTSAYSSSIIPPPSVPSPPL